MYRSRAVLDAGYDKIICSLTLLRRLPLASSCDEASDLLKGPPVHLAYRLQQYTRREPGIQCCGSWLSA